jgi:NAD(P)H-hydrate epimerase
MKYLEKEYNSSSPLPQPLYHLMQNAGFEAAMLILAHTPPHASFFILAGTGNNGGDALIVALILKRHHRNVSVFAPSTPSSPLRNQALIDSQITTLPLSQFSPASLPPSSYIIDGLLGTGLNRNIKGEISTTLQKLAAHPHIPIFALDILSGCSADNGKIFSEKPLPHAHITIAFHRPKIGHFILPTKERSGKLIVVDIGLPEFNQKLIPLSSDTLIPNHPSLPTLTPPHPSLNTHKYSRGLLAIKASPLMPGAAILAAKAARKVGCGIIILFAPQSHAPLILSLCDTSMIVKPFKNTKHLASLIQQESRISALILGPGDTDFPSLQKILTLIPPSLPRVLDAGIFQAFADKPSDFIQTLSQLPPEIAVLTPHDREYSYVFSPPKSLSSRHERALFAAEKTQQVVLLKGNDTSIASPSQPTRIETLAPTSLATAGSGDVLSGIIGALLAQNIPSKHAAAHASNLHSLAAHHPKNTQKHTTAEQLINSINPLLLHP